MNNFLLGIWTGLCIADVVVYGYLCSVGAKRVNFPLSSFIYLWKSRKAHITKPEGKDAAE